MARPEVVVLKLAYLWNLGRTVCIYHNRLGKHPPQHAPRGQPQWGGVPLSM